MYCVSIELYKHEWKFGGTRNAVGTWATGECFRSFFEFSQTFTFRKQRDEKTENLLTLIIKMEILFAYTITTSTVCTSSVSPSSYTNTIFNQSARVLS